MRSNMTRRQLLTSSALGAAALVVGATGANAAVSTSSLSHSMMHDVSACSHNHHALGHQLSTLIADPNVDETVKNHAIKTSACPDCGTGIAPTGLGLAAKTWV